MRNHSLFGPLLFVLVMLGGCASPPYNKPEFLDTRFDPQATAQIAVAPVLDLRVDKTEELALDAWVHNTAREFMTRRGYKVTTYADRALVDPLQGLATPAAVADGIKDVVVSGGPRHVLVFALVDAYSKLTFGSTGNAEMAAYLVDQQQRAIVWRHSVIGQIGQGGLLGMAMKGMMTRAAIESATMKLVYSIPPRESAK